MSFILLLGMFDLSDTVCTFPCISTLKKQFFLPVRGNTAFNLQVRLVEDLFWLPFLAKFH